MTGNCSLQNGSNGEVFTKSLPGNVIISFIATNFEV